LLEPFGDHVVVPSLRHAHVNWIIQISLQEGLGVIDLARGKAQDGRQDEHKADGTPLYNGSVSVPIIDAKLLFGTVKTDLALVFGEIAIRFALAAIRPYRIEQTSASRKACEFTHKVIFENISILETFNFGSLRLDKFVAVRSSQHLGLAKTIRIVIGGGGEGKRIDFVNQTSQAFDGSHINNLVFSCQNVKESL